MVPVLARRHAVVYRYPYEFSVPGAEKDYIMQDAVEEAKKKK